MSVQNLIQNTNTNLLGSKFPSNHLKLERSPGVMIFTHACGTVTVAQLSSGRCRYDPHFPSMCMFITRSLFSCCWYRGKFRSNMGANVSTIKKHLQNIYKNFHSSNASSVSVHQNDITLLRLKFLVMKNSGENIAHSELPYFLKRNQRYCKLLICLTLLQRSTKH